MIKYKSIWDPINKKEDGLRIQATRFSGRGVPKTRRDVWMANLAPTEMTLKSFQADKMTWKEFSRQYKKELLYSHNMDKRNDVIRNYGQKFTLRLISKLARKQNVTLMCHCDTDEEQCHLRILEEVLNSNKI